MQKQRIILIIGVVLALIATFLVKMYLDQQSRNASKAAEEVAKVKYERMQREVEAAQTPVLVAKEDIPAGVALEPQSLEVKVVPNQFVQPQAVTSFNRITGMFTVAPIVKDEQITLTKLAYQKQQGSAGGLAEVTPTGKRAITIRVDEITSVGGMTKAGDYVDVLTIVGLPVRTADGKEAMQTTIIPLFQRVLVLAVGQQIAAAPAAEPGSARYKEEKPAFSPLITLSLGPQEASIISFIQEQQGKIQLVLRSPADGRTEPVSLITWDTLLQYLSPAKGEEATLQSKKEEYIEIYRGLNKERLPLSEERK
ncbi:Flp pilus assembly protein CpaB [bacterium]|nr:MAG: Flp pilus assembly protein CpaB [bacterium]